MKEDEYFRDGITEDIITELSKIQGMHVYSRPTVLAYRDKPVTPAQIGQQLKAAYVLAGSLRRSGNRLRITAQLVDTRTDFPLWSERYDREMKDVFEVQDEIARKIAEALRIKLTPQDQEALAAKPTENLQAYDHYLRGRGYARRLTRQDLEFALQMFNDAVALDPEFALAHAAIANACAHFFCRLRAGNRRGSIARAPRRRRRSRCGPTCPRSWSRRPGSSTRGASTRTRRASCVSAIARKPDCEGAYYLLAARAVRVGPAPGGRRHRRGGDRGFGHRLQRLRPDPEFARRPRQAGGGAERPRARDPGVRDAPPAGARGRARTHPPRLLLRRDRPHRRRHARGEDGDDAAAERVVDPLQRRLHLLPDAPEGGGDRRAGQGVAAPASATPTGCAATRISPSSTAIRSSSGCIPRRTQKGAEKSEGS